jgi:hypothetical protein
VSVNTKRERDREIPKQTLVFKINLLSITTDKRSQQLTVWDIEHHLLSFMRRKKGPFTLYIYSIQSSTYPETKEEEGKKHI